MEYRLNKIDTDLRQKVNDMTKEGKVHSKKEIKISKDKGGQEENKNFKEVYKKVDKKKVKICVDATKKEDLGIEAEKDRDENSPKGIFLDVRK